MNTFNVDPSILAKAESYVESEDMYDEETSANKMAEKIARAVTKPTTKAKATVKVAKDKTKRVTKASQAQEIYKKFAGDKAQTIQAFMDDLGMSKAGATTYFYNAKKAA